MKAEIINSKKDIITTVQIKSTDTSIPNIIRCILQSEIPVYAIDTNTIEYGECDTIQPIEMITSTIGLIPVKQNLSPDVAFNLHAEFDENKVPPNDTSFEPRNMIMSDDIKSNNGLQYFHPNMPIIELRKYVGKININKMTLIKKPQLYNSRHQACKTYYEIIEQKNNYFTIKLTLKPISNKYPEYSMSTYTAYNQSIDILINKLKNLRSGIENNLYITSETEIHSDSSYKALKLIKIKIDDESRQFAYLLQCQIFNMPEYSGKDYLVGFNFNHPLTRTFILSFQWDENFHKGTYKTFLLKAFTSLIKTINNLKI